MRNKFSIFNFQFSKRNLNRGFTLIELLVVIAIIGVLASFLVTNYVEVRKRARDAQRKSDLRQVQSALEIFRADQASYPPVGNNNGQFSFPASCSTPRALKNTAGTITYMQKIPCDPTNTAPNLIYRYISAPPNSTYTLVACLENGNDQQKDNPNNGIYCNGTSNWSYTLLSP